MNAANDEIFLYVKPTDVVDPILERFKGIRDSQAVSSYYEPVYFIGEDVPAFIFGEDIPAVTTGEEVTESHCHTRVTFEQCGIKHGDTLHLLLTNRRYIVIQNEFNDRDEIHYLLPLLTTIATLKDILRRDSENRVDHLPAEKLALEIGDTLLDDSKTLADCNIGEDNKIHLRMMHSRIPIGVPTYSKMEQVLFKPGDTIANLKDAIERMMPDFECTAGMRAAYPVPLRGAVKYASGAASYFYLDLFCGKMKMFTYKRGTDDLFHHYACFLDGGYTLDDIWRILRREFGDCAYCHDRVGGGAFPMHYCFDHVWTQTFASQIEAQPLSPKMPMPLFFFPLYIKIVQLPIPPTLSRISEIIHQFCESERSMKGMDRALCHSRTKAYSTGCRVLVSGGEPLSVIITKRDRGDREALGECITIQLGWHSTEGMRIVPFRIRPSDTINHLQDLIEDDIKVPYFIQKLMLDGRRVQGDSTLQEAGIKDGSILDLHPLLDDE